MRAVTSILLLFALSASPFARAEDSLEYRVKAGCMLNFAKFVEWPKAAFPDKKTPLVLGTLGDNPFGPALENTAADREVDGHRVIVRKYKDASEAREAHVLFVGLKGESLEKAMKALAGTPTLTVGEQDAFIEAGGMVRFVLRDQKVAFDINPDAAKKSGLKIAAQLLRLAKIVNAKGE
ncbi:MAG: YfiR family protein [Planctomycetota bacterium]|nr:YfiR family protein [Planctomycetota bacterium]